MMPRAIPEARRAEKTGGVLRALRRPAVYDALQSLMGARRGRREFAAEFVRARTGDRVLDIGCGTADLLVYLPTVDYRGYDISEDYIRAARARFAGRGQFVCGQLDDAELAVLPVFDIVIASALLHHLDDHTAVALLKRAQSTLRPGGRLVTIDPCIVSAQNPVAAYLIRHDRGQHVRTAEAYRTLAQSVFPNSTGVIRHRRWVPYTHWIMECVT